MITNEELKINEEIYKQKRSISSKIGNDINEQSNASKGLKSRHRKMASSYFLGSYISGDELHKFMQEYKGVNKDNKNNNKYKNDNGINNNNLNIYDKNDINNLKDLLLKNKNDYNLNENNKNNDKEKITPLANSSFYSYSIEDENENKNNDKKTNENQDNGSIIIRGDNADESLTNNCETKSNSYANNPFYELEKNSEKYNKDKSFIPIKNGLKYLKDKEERVTESYLMALNGGELSKKNEKNQYLPTASIIEEEKSELIESTSKKQSIIKGTKLIKEINFKKKKIENEFNLIKNNDDILEKSNEDENKENIDVNINNNNNNNNNKNSDIDIYDNTTVKKCPKLDFDLNKIKIKNNCKEEKKRKCLRKNKENLLKCFYNLSCNKSIPSSSTSLINNNSSIQKNDGNGISNNNINNINYNQLLNKNNKIIINNNINNINKISINKEKNKELIKSSSRTLIRLPPNIIRKKRNFSYSGGYISFLYRQRFNTENSDPKNNEKVKYNISKYIYKKNDKNIIYHIYSNNCRENHIKKKLNKSMNNQILSGIKNNPKMKIPHKKFDKSLINNKNNELSSKNINIYNNKEKKILLDKSHRRAISISKDNIVNIINKKMTKIGEIERINIINKGDSLLFCDMKTNFDSSKILNHRKKQNKDNFKIPTHSDSNSFRGKEKIRDKIINNKNSKKKLYLRKANSGMLNTKFESEIEDKNEFDINISNKNQTFIILKEKIKFLKTYEKNDVLEKINKTLNCNKSNFIILCDNNNGIFIFHGLFKYYENQKRFIKIYGNEKVPNVILIKNINSSNYIMYENKIIQNEENKTQFFFDQIHIFYFSFNSIIICKK